MRYKARLVAQNFLQRPGIDYEEMHSSIVDAITFRYLIRLTASEGLDMHLMVVVTAYLYRSLDNDINMKISEGLIKMPEECNLIPQEMCSVKLQRSLYGLKQSGHMWYNCLSEYLLKEGFVNNPICPCVFIKRSDSGFAVIVVYVDDLNINGTCKELKETIAYLNRL